MGEAGEDGGGPRREFWALLSNEIRSSLFEGVGSHLVLRHDAVGLQVSSRHAYPSTMHVLCNCYCCNRGRSFTTWDS